MQDQPPPRDSRQPALTGGPTAPVRPSAFAETLRRLESIRPLFLVLAGPRLGARFPFTGTPMLLGRSLRCHVPLPDDGISAEHLEILPEPDGRFRLRDLGSRNGTTVNGVRFPEHVLVPGDRVVVGATPLRYVEQTEAEEDLLQYLERSAVEDPLTLLRNRRYFDLRLEEEVRFARRHQAPLALLMLDIDHFKRINDSLGHPAGDRVLVELAALLRTLLRAEDVLARVGGEEFAAILRQTPRAVAVETAERLRAAVADLRPHVEGRPLEVTVSLGAAALGDGRDLDAAGLVAAADQALYRAKHEGRNRVCAA